MEGGLTGELHVELRIATIHTGLDAIVYLLVVTVGGVVLVSELSDAAESQEGMEAQGRGTVRIQKSITDQDTVLVMLKYHFPLQDDTTDAVNRCRHFVAVELTDILMSVRTEVIPLILV